MKGEKARDAHYLSVLLIFSYKNTVVLSVVEGTTSNQMALSHLQEILRFALDDEICITSYLARNEKYSLKFLQTQHLYQPNHQS